MYHWNRKSPTRNDYFVIVLKDGLGIGGAGHFSIFLDGDLTLGSSGQCGTFCSPCLASSESFTIKRIEYWGLVEWE